MKIIDLGNGAECETDDYGNKYWYLNGKEYSEEDFDMVKEVLWAV